MAEQKMETLMEQWQFVCRDLRRKVGDSAFESWLEPMALGGFRDGILSLYLPTRFMRDYIVRHFADDVSEIWREHNPEIESLVFDVGRPTASALPNSYAAPTVAEPQPAEVPDMPEPAEKDDLSAALDPRFTFDNFVVGKPNEFAYAAARRVAESDAVSFNPLYLYSGVGLGKTHLMHSIAWHIRERNPSRKVVYLSAEKFMYRFIRAIRFKDTFSFKEQLRAVDVLMIDDVQFLIGKENTQEEFFHTFNALVDQGKQIVLSADKPPVNLEGIEDRLKTRLGLGLVADIHPTTYELRLGILETKAQSLGVFIPQDVIEFLAEKMTSSVRELEGALIRVASHVQLMGGSVTLDRTREILRDVLNVLDRRVTIEEIQRKVAEHYNIRISEMQSKRRERNVARPRQVAMFLSKTLTPRSLPEIGRKFDRDHTTVIHAVRKVEEMMGEDASFRDEVEGLRRSLSL
jgi:chromosomal replication initiator protein